MGLEDRKLVADASAWLLNVSTSVLIIFLNKAVMSVYKFTFATTICAFHFLACAGSIWAAEKLGFTTRQSIPIIDALLFSLVGSVSIASANLSLLLNSIGFYQISKLLLAPFVCGVEIFWLRKHFSVPVLLSIGVVLTGVAVVTVSDVTVNLQGLIMACVFVVSSGMQQILVGFFQTKFKIGSHQLLANTAPIQGTLLLITGPAVDKLVSHRWLSEWEPSVPGIEMLILSCGVAVAVNISQFLCLGRFSATSFQVLGHAKTVLVLVGGWLLFAETVNERQLIGMLTAVIGMVLYGFFSSRQHAAASRGAAIAPFAASQASSSAGQTPLGLTGLAGGSGVSGASGGDRRGGGGSVGGAALGGSGTTMNRLSGSGSAARISATGNGSTGDLLLMDGASRGKGEV